MRYKAQAKQSKQSKDFLGINIKDFVKENLCKSLVKEIMKNSNNIEEVEDDSGDTTYSIDVHLITEQEFQEYQKFKSRLWRIA